MKNRFALKVALAALTIAPSQAQDAPQFEAASIKPSKPGVRGSLSVNQSQLLWTNGNLRQFIMTAFNLHDYSFSAPSWIESAEFDIAAKMPAGGPPGQMNQMLKTLLTQKFKLAYHYEKRNTNGYALVLAKSGLKIQPSQGGESHGTGRPGLLTGKNFSMANLAGMLSGIVQGVYDIDITWTPEAGAPTMSPTDQPAPAADPGPTLFNVLEEKLGLKLEPRKLPVDVLILDHADRTPAEN
jgi:uncharacterized protein (TIGR03435 family)